MILFLADNHYNAFSGKNIHGEIENDYAIDFSEDDFAKLADINSGKYQLLMLHMIAGTCNNDHPDQASQDALKTYLEKGGNMLLLHGSSAAFWEWDWWRKIVGHRWVRRDDPDGSEQSTHPVEPYSVSLCNAIHPLAKKLQPMDFDTDEIYINLEQTAPTIDLMETYYDKKRYVQAWSCPTPWGGEIIGLLPGHAPSVTSNPQFLANLKTIINYLQP
ncbi:ThuA domain-containing protein [Lentisphaera profundi]|uniref:ThuA domain-containing protein n=1 Tax=Lentisphaera profundi TaxID=1658616 RepID=A0ABY7VMZ2_9BACT|nr:ThuA domain-containing protein [Lentisphaera profundi]WDE95222.1 ThuA domain-containing protein [Lentisphaera profundi]